MPVPFPVSALPGFWETGLNPEVTVSMGSSCLTPDFCVLSVTCSLGSRAPCGGAGNSLFRVEHSMVTLVPHFPLAAHCLPPDPHLCLVGFYSVLGVLFAASWASHSCHSECCAVEQAQQEEGEEGDSGGPQAGTRGLLLQALLWLVQHHPRQHLLTFCKTKRACQT